jgi:uncharacterized membrane protein AbrB (regulator of aidB expression)
MQILRFAAANILGRFFAYVDSRPNWDDTGVLVGMIVMSAVILGSLGPRRPWLCALAIGVWMPLQEALTTHRPPASAVAIVFALAGAYLGAGLRRLAIQAS